MNIRNLLSLTGCIALLAAPVLFAAQDGGKITEGRLDAIGPEGKSLGPCPLRHTDVVAEIAGTVARVTVTQQFHNPFKDKIEAVYVFPLHEDCAVDDMTMTVGDRVVKGVIKERGEAKRIYEEAKAQGKVASLLDQERPNIFTQSVANIEPGEKVTIEIKYSQTMNWEDGRFEFDFPTVVGPRYIPGAASGEVVPNQDPPVVEPMPRPRPPVGGPQPLPRGRADNADNVEVAVPEKVRPPGDERPMPSFFRKPNPQRGPEGEPPVVNPNPAEPTGQVPDADRITPPVVEEGFRAGHDISITVHIDAGLKIRDLKSLQHEVKVKYEGSDKSRAVVTLEKKAVIPNRDFEISYRTAGDKITDTVLTHTDERGKFFTVILQPPARIVPEQIVPRELVFVLDTSGSMSGFPMETSKAMMRRAINNLRPRDRFNIVTFAGSTSVLFNKPVGNTEENRAEALRFIDTLQGAGGTEMMKAINTALGGEHDAQAVRIVCFLTDGYVGNDMAIVGAVKENARTTRVFSFGIGSSVNRFLMDKMANAGRGTAHYVLNHEQAKPTADKFYERIDAPVLTDIELEYSGIEVDEVYPQRVEDLFAARPVVVKGRYTKGGKGTITLKGTNAAGSFQRGIDVDFPDNAPGNGVLASQWARAKVAHLMMQDMEGAQQGKFDDKLKKQVIGLGLAYNLLTQFTSFVAVEELKITEGGKARTINVPVEMPEDVSYSGVFGDRGAALGTVVYSAARKSRSGLGGGGYAPSLTTGTRVPSPVAAAPMGRPAADSAREVDAERVEEATFIRLDERQREGNLTPAEKKEQLLPLKLEESLKKLADSGSTEKVEVRVILRDFSDEAIAKLEALGFKVLAKATSVKMVVGKVGADKLVELALLQVVRRIEPAGS